VKRWSSVSFAFQPLADWRVWADGCL